ncbi:MAG TPA: PEGA domain-containing protein [Blastocatellia bacterium]|nr:PEGA domain-containing protein [Blastocatellia bacterium]
MKLQRTQVCRRGRLPGAIILLVALCLVAASQILPPSITGEVKETARTAAPIVRKVSKAVPVEQRKGVLVILTDPPDAQISINGKVAGTAEAGQFKTELPLGRRYVVRVSSGSEYDPVEKSFSFGRDRSEIIQAPLVSKYALLRIGPEIEGARLFINDKEVEKGRLRQEKESNTIVLDGLPPGDYRVRYEHPDFVPLERQLKVAPSREYLITFKSVAATTEMIVKSGPGVSVYIDNEEIGQTTPDGTLRKEVRLGRHEVRLYKDGFQEHKEARQFAFGKREQLEKMLTPLPASSPFREFFDSPNKQWEMPKEATVKGGALYLSNCPRPVFAVALRYFDFKLHFHLTLENDGGAAWALRAKDGENYYLFYLSGPQGAFKNQFNIYVVRNNRLDLNDPVSTARIPFALKPDGQYEIDIEFTGNKVKHTITPADTGKAITLDYSELREDVYPYGTIGFRTIGKEKFLIDDVIIEPLQAKGRQN